MSARHQKSNIRKQDIEHNFLINFPSHSKSIFGKLCKNPNSEILELQNNCQDQKRSKCSKHIFWEMFKQANIVAMHILCACIPSKIRHQDICDRCLHWPSVLYWPQEKFYKFFKCLLIWKWSYKKSKEKSGKVRTNFW